VTILPFPDDAGPRCDACKGRGWIPGECHPREVCGTCNGTGYPKSWAAGEIARLDTEVARLTAALAEHAPLAPERLAALRDRCTPITHEEVLTLLAERIAPGQDDDGTPFASAASWRAANREAQDRADKAEAKVEAGLDLARTWDQGTECNEVGCRNSFHSAARALRAALGNKK
jgi:hypothetical protein